MMRGPVARPWRFDFELSKAADVPLHEQLVRAIVGDIQRGRLAPGMRLPGSRPFADALGVNRKVVVAAIEGLRAQGWLETLPSSGVRVARDLPALAVADARAAAPRSRIQAAAKGDLELTDGTPNPRLAPLDVIARAQRRALRSLAVRGLGYGDPAGDPVCREVLAGFANSARGLSCQTENVLVTRGSQMALSLVAMTLIKRGDVVAVEAPGYLPAWQAFAFAGATIVHVPVDDDGLVVERLDALAAKAKGRMKAAYVTPHHQYPTTVAMSAERRMQLRAVARARQLTIVEDDYDYEYDFEGKPLLPLSAAPDPEVRTIYVASLSKLLAPALRIGYMIAPPNVVRDAAAVRAVLDRQGDVVLERAVADMIEDGELGRHARRARKVYRERRDIFVRGVAEEPRLRRLVETRSPSGGLATWLRARPGFSIPAWILSASRHGLRFASGTGHAARASVIGVRAGFATFSTDELARVVELLAKSAAAVDIGDDDETFDGRTTE